MNRTFWKSLLPVFAVITLAVYCKTLTGKVPFPHEIILHFAPWAGLNHAITNQPYASIGDLATQMYPFRAFAARSVRSGNLPLWNPYLLSGTPFLGNSQSAVFYPPNALAYVFTLPVAWGLSLMVRTFLAGIFMVLFIGSLGGSKTAAIIGGVLFALCGFVTAWQGFPIGDAAIWLPLIFYGVIKLRQTSARTALLITSTAFAMPVIAGHPETAVHMTFAGVLFALALLVIPGISLVSRTEFLLRFALAGCLALGIAAIQMLPSVEWLTQIDFTPAIRWPPLDISQALGFVSRDVLRSVNSASINIPESASYIAMIAFVAAPLAALHSAKRYAGILFFLSLAAFMVAFGLNPAHWLAVHTPLLQSIKNGRLLLVVDFCLAGLTGLGISAVEEGAFGGKRKLAALIFTTGGFLVAFALVYALQRHTGFRVEFLRRPSFSRGLLLMGFGLVILRILNYMPRRAFAVTICAVATFDAVTFAYGYTGFAPPQDIFPPAPVFEFLQRTVQPGRFRVADFGDVYPANSNLMYGTPSVDGYDLPLRRLRLFTKGMRPESQTGVSSISRRWKQMIGAWIS